MKLDSEATTSKKRRVKPSVWRRIYAWGPFGLVVLLWFYSLVFNVGIKHEIHSPIQATRWHLKSTWSAIRFQLFGYESRTTYRFEPNSKTEFNHSLRPIAEDISTVVPGHMFENETLDHGTHVLTKFTVYVPYWSLILISGAWLALLSWWRKRRGQTDCLNCGYDLRGSTGACPECGSVPKPQRASTGNVQ